MLLASAAPMRSFACYLSLVSCSVVLAAAGDGPSVAAPVAQAHTVAVEQGIAAVTASPSAVSATSQPTPRPRPRFPRLDRPVLVAQTGDERLAHALERLGAERGARGEVLELRHAQFAPGQADFEIKAGSGTHLAQLVRVLRRYPKARLIVEGYTDDRGSAQLNDRLSLERAAAVRQALVVHGLRATAIRTRGRGSAYPVADNGTRSGRAMNRRVELVFSNAAGAFAPRGDQVAAGSDS